MKDKEKETYPVEIDKETMLAFNDLIYFCGRTFPYMDPKLKELNGKFSRIVGYGCFKHGLMCRTVFEVADKYGERRISFCPKCEPDLAKRYKDKLEKVLDENPYI